VHGTVNGSVGGRVGRGGGRGGGGDTCVRHRVGAIGKLIARVACTVVSVAVGGDSEAAGGCLQLATLGRVGGGHLDARAVVGVAVVGVDGVCGVAWVERGRGGGGRVGRRRGRGGGWRGGGTAAVLSVARRAEEQIRLRRVLYVAHDAPRGDGDQLGGDGDGYAREGGGLAEEGELVQLECGSAGGVGSSGGGAGEAGGGRARDGVGRAGLDGDRRADLVARGHQTDTRAVVRLIEHAAVRGDGADGEHTRAVRLARGRAARVSVGVASGSDDGDAFARGEADRGGQGGGRAAREADRGDGGGAGDFVLSDGPIETSEHVGSPPITVAAEDTDSVQVSTAGNARVCAGGNASRVRAVAIAVGPRPSLVGGPVGKDILALTKPAGELDVERIDAGVKHVDVNTISSQEAGLVLVVKITLGIDDVKIPLHIGRGGGGAGEGEFRVGEALQPAAADTGSGNGLVVLDDGLVRVRIHNLEGRSVERRGEPLGEGAELVLVGDAGSRVRSNEGLELGDAARVLEQHDISISFNITGGGGRGGRIGALKASAHAGIVDSAIRAGGPREP